jgi:hypothetical protein
MYWTDLDLKQCLLKHFPCRLANVILNVLKAKLDMLTHLYYSTDSQTGVGVIII